MKRTAFYYASLPPPPPSLSLPAGVSATRCRCVCNNILAGSQTQPLGPLQLPYYYSWWDDLKRSCTRGSPPISPATVYINKHTQTSDFEDSTSLQECIENPHHVSISMVRIASLNHDDSMRCNAYSCIVLHLFYTLMTLYCLLMPTLCLAMFIHAYSGFELLIYAYFFIWNVYPCQLYTFHVFT